MLVHKKFSDTLKTHKKFSVRTQNFLWNRQFLMLKNFYVWTQKFLWNQSHICLVRAVGQHDTIWCRCLSGVLVSTLVSGSQQLSVQQFNHHSCRISFSQKNVNFTKIFVLKHKIFWAAISWWPEPVLRITKIFVLKHKIFWAAILVARTSITIHKKFCVLTQKFLRLQNARTETVLQITKIFVLKHKTFWGLPTKYSVHKHFVTVTFCV